MPCSGCGGKGHSPGDTYGHILGCGASRFLEDERYNPLTMAEQDEILFDAVNIALKSEQRPGTKEFATALGRALAEQLGARCVERRLYPT